ncbi:Metallo-dependent phosphatase-like protein [Aspergillus pseudoustus]|uniref:Endopolyphosphatase n=1 Tax=Aspergillus pseudoustus TaxID=1810923 RepID=A0ABR4JST6_9EURO
MIPHRVLPVLCGLGIAACASAIPLTEQVSEQQILGDDVTSVTQPSGQLSGRFLHITDFHLDTHYKSGTSVERVCHREKGTAGPLGAQGTECDAPQTLIDETFRWIETNLKGKIDFVLWTGDSARHDNDERIPRTAGEIIDLNEVLATKFIDVFEDKETPRGLSIPIIPTIGNNDIMPHNIFKEGPNRWTRRFTEVWARFIPEHQRHTFEEGGWFLAEVIPNKLAALSLNTMYFYESNSAVDGCAAKSEPGYEHMEWLRIQLELLRERDMKAILIGHVPPARAGSKRNWDESCWQKYTLFLNRFRDVVAGSVYGHMNIDHFMLQDSHDVDILAAASESESENSSSHDPEFAVQSRSTYLNSLRENWAEMPSPPAEMSSLESWSADFFDADAASEAALGKKAQRFLHKIGGPWAERYSVSLVSPSVVPNYFPTLRVIEYNTTGLEGVTLWSDSPYSDDSVESVILEDIDTDELDEEIAKKKHGKKGKNNKKKKPSFKVPNHPSPTAPPGPAYSDQTMTWLSYAQYFANLSHIYGDSSSESESEHSQQPSSTSKENANANADVSKSLDLYTVEYDTCTDKTYKLKDLTVRSYFELAKRIANKNRRKHDAILEVEEEEEEAASSESSAEDETDPLANGKKNGNRKKKHRNRVWRTFLERAFVGFLSDDELDDIIESEVPE